MLTQKKLAQILLRLVSLPLFLCCLGLLAEAHNGPPFAIVVDQNTGPCKISVWTHPDIGVGTFFVLVDPLPGSSIPSDLKIDLGIQPISGRLPEVMYPMQRDNGRGQLQYNAQVDFDKQDYFRVRVHLQSSAGSGEVTSQVEATPQGFGRWDLLFYLAPFLLIAALFYRGVRKKQKNLAQKLSV
jgi:hypothetical protein